MNEHQVVPKVWGSETIICNRAFAGKVMTLRRGMRCSLHYHPVKDETFWVLSGKVRVEIGQPGMAGVAAATREMVLDPGDSVDVPPLTLHRFTGITDATFVELSTHDDPADSIRLTPSGPA